MSSLLRVRPTKIELIRLRRRLELSRKVHRILRERLTILVNEFLSRIREAIELRRSVSVTYLSVYKEAIALYSFYGEKLQEHLNNTVKKPTQVILGQENIMGIKTLSTQFIQGDYIKTPIIQDINIFREKSIELLQRVIELGEIERALYALGKEIIRTKRKVNALEYILIPQLRNTIRYLQMKFEEREREEKARLKRVKAMLERRKSNV